tara:strand:+ start:767 stop:1708 length:942 start_codon:yes stop_codon:yes gene_type:complete
MSNEFKDKIISKDDVIDLSEFFNVIWHGKTSIIVITVAFAIFSVFYSLSLTNFYMSEALLVNTASSNDRNNISALNGLASIAGINLPSSGQGKTRIVMGTLKSRAFVKHLIQFDDILPSLMAAKSYNPETKALFFDTELYDPIDKVWLKEKNSDQSVMPSYLDAYEEFNNRVIVEQDKVSSLISIQVEHISPIFAKDFLELIIGELNELLRQQDLQESSDAIDFLTSQIPKSSLISMKDSINQLVKSRLEMQMMAKITTEYALKIIEPPFTPEKKFKPRRSIICIIGTLLGGVFAVFWILFRYYILGNLKLTN